MYRQLFMLCLQFLPSQFDHLCNAMYLGTRNFISTFWSSVVAVLFWIGGSMVPLSCTRMFVKSPAVKKKGDVKLAPAVVVRRPKCTHWESQWYGYTPLTGYPCCGLRLRLETTTSTRFTGNGSLVVSTQIFWPSI
jgi:hypothetical protein